MKRILRHFGYSVLVLCVSALTACDFQPIYGTRDGPAANDVLSQVEVLPVPARIGQLFVASLEDKLNPDSRITEKRYALQPTINIQLLPISISRDGTVGRYRVFYDTGYTLVDRQTGKQIQSEKVRRSGSYEVSNVADYSTYVAEQDAIARGLDELSQDYFLRLSSFLQRYDEEQATKI